MGDKISGYTADEASNPIKREDLLDVSNEDGAAGYDLSKKIKVHQFADHLTRLAGTNTPSGTTQTLDFNNGFGSVLDLGSATGDVTLTLSNPVAGASYFIKIIQGATFRDVVFPSSVKFPSQTAPYTLNVTESDNAIDSVVLFYDGSNYIANFSQNYG